MQKTDLQKEQEADVLSHRIDMLMLFSLVQYL
jgi:hypothetical protein